MVFGSAGENMELKMNRRGVFFLIIVLVVVSLLVASYTVYKNFEERKTIRKRVETMNSFIKSLEVDLSRQIFISGFRSIFIMEKRILETGNYIDNVNLRFKELFMNGTIYEETDPNITILMEGATFEDIELSASNRASKINVETIMTEPTISVTQNDPWNVNFSIMFNLTVRDQGGLAVWNKEETISAIVPISGFQDPIYTVESNNPSVVNSINITPYNTFDSSSLLIHASNSFYMNSTDAPNFIHRLEGNLSAVDETGIESLVYVPGLPASNQYSKTIVDHIYWSSGNPGQCQISGQPSWLMLDSSHLDIYNAECA